MDFKDLVALYFERTNAMQTLWSIYITLVLGLLGFLGVAELRAPHLRILLPLIFAFCGFAYVNCDALRSVTNQRNIAVDLIRQFKPTVGSKEVDPNIQAKISGTLDPPTVASVTWFHVTSDILTLIAIAALGFRRE